MSDELLLSKDGLTWRKAVEIIKELEANNARLEKERDEYKTWMRDSQHRFMKSDTENVRLRAENARLDWQDMKTAPTDGAFIIAALRVYRAKDKKFFKWEVYVVARDIETGDAITMNGDDCGWSWGDFEVWKPINIKSAARAAMGESDE